MPTRGRGTNNMLTRARGTNNMLTRGRGTNNMLTRGRGTNNMLTRGRGTNNMLTRGRGTNNMLTKPKSTNKLLKIRRLEKMSGRCRLPSDRIAALAAKILPNSNYSIDAKSLAGAILYIRKYLKRDHKFLGIQVKCQRKKP
jgi:hypothetical protein